MRLDLIEHFLNLIQELLRRISALCKLSQDLCMILFQKLLRRLDHFAVDLQRLFRRESIR